MDIFRKSDNFADRSQKRDKLRFRCQLCRLKTDYRIRRLDLNPISVSDSRSQVAANGLLLDSNLDSRAMLPSDSSAVLVITNRRYIELSQHDERPQKGLRKQSRLLAVKTSLPFVSGVNRIVADTRAMSCSPLFATKACVEFNLY